LAAITPSTCCAETLHQVLLFNNKIYGLTGAILATSELNKSEIDTFLDH